MPAAVLSKMRRLLIIPMNRIKTVPIFPREHSDLRVHLLPCSRAAQHAYRNPFTESQGSKLPHPTLRASAGARQGIDEVRVHYEFEPLPTCEDEVKIEIPLAPAASRETSSKDCTPDGKSPTITPNTKQSDDALDFGIYQTRMTGELAKNFALMAALKWPSEAEVVKHSVKLPEQRISPKKKTLFLDLDDTLIHVLRTEADWAQQKRQPKNYRRLELVVNGEIYVLHILLRPFLELFLDSLRPVYELIVS